MNLQSQCIEVYREPTFDGFKKRVDVERQGRVAPLALPTVSVAVAEIFG